MAALTVRVTGKITGNSLIIPFSHTDGLQMYPAGHRKEGQAVLYKIAKYQMSVAGGDTFDVVRFGLQNNGKIAASRRSDAGLSVHHRTHPSWVAGYSPHSFHGGPYAGAWRILAGRGFLIHEGADSRVGQVGGSLGCVEVLDGGWQVFMDQLQTLCGEPWPKIASKHLLTVEMEGAPYPTATLV